jgi:hypothetical protein
MSRRGERPMVPDATFTSYYGQPIINAPVWKAPDIAGYLFLGGLAGASSVVALGASLIDSSGLARVAKVGAAGAISLGAAGLVHDLGRPERFVNMLRVFKPTSPMSVGSWLLAAYGPAAAASAGSAMTGFLPGVGTAATVGAAALGPFVSTYTAALISDTSVPAWHAGHREMPYLFAGSSLSAAGGLGLLAAPIGDVGPARVAALVGATGEIAAARLMQQRLGEVAEPYQSGKGGRLMRAAEALTVAGVVGAVVGGRSRLTRIAGMAMLAGSALTRFGVFEAGMASARDPKYTVKPQRERLRTEPVVEGFDEVFAVGG